MDTFTTSMQEVPTSIVAVESSRDAAYHLILSRVSRRFPSANHLISHTHEIGLRYPYGFVEMQGGVHCLWKNATDESMSVFCVSTSANYSIVDFLTQSQWDDSSFDTALLLLKQHLNSVVTDLTGSCSAPPIMSDLASLLETRPDRLYDEADKTVEKFCLHLPDAIKNLPSIQTLRRPTMQQIFGHYFDRLVDPTDTDTLYGLVLVANVEVQIKLKRCGNGWNVTCRTQDVVVNYTTVLPLTRMPRDDMKDRLQRFSIHTDILANPLGIIRLLANEIGVVEDQVADETMSVIFDDLSIGHCVYGYVSSRIKQIVADILNANDIGVNEIVIGYERGNRAIFAVRSKHIDDFKLAPWSPIIFVDDSKSEDIITFFETAGDPNISRTIAVNAILAAFDDCLLQDFTRYETSIPHGEDSAELSAEYLFWSGNGLCFALYVTNYDTQIVSAGLSSCTVVQHREPSYTQVLKSFLSEPNVIGFFPKK